jgi:hypothetical protein
MISTVLLITRRERKQTSYYTDLQNKLDDSVWVLILTTPLAPFLQAIYGATVQQML